MTAETLSKPECGELFGTKESRASGWDPATVLRTIYSEAGGRLSGVWVGYKVLNNWPFVGTASVSWAIANGGLDYGLRVEINAREWNDLSSVTFDNTGAKYQAAGLIHEMGHTYGLISLLGSGGSQIKYDGIPLLGGPTSEANDKLVLGKCFGITN